MKILVSFFIAAVLALSLCSCGNDQAVDINNSKEDPFESNVSLEESSGALEKETSYESSEEFQDAIESETATGVFADSKFQSYEVLNYVALGDSIARGYGLKDPVSGCYPALLSKALSKVLPNTSVNYTNYAVDGLTTEGLIRLLSDGCENVDGADLITVSIGANNLLGPFISVAEKHMAKFVTSPDDITEESLSSSTVINSLKAIQEELESDAFAAVMQNGIAKLDTELDGIINELKRRSPHAVIVVMTVYSPYHGIDLSLPYLGLSFDLGSLSDKWVSELDVEIRRIVEENECILVETYDSFETMGGLVNASLSLLPLNVSFDPHPNQKGHALLSNLHMNVISAIK